MTSAMVGSGPLKVTAFQAFELQGKRCKSRKGKWKSPGEIQPEQSSLSWNREYARKHIVWIHWLLQKETDKPSWFGVPKHLALFPYKLQWLENTGDQHCSCDPPYFLLIVVWSSPLGFQMLCVLLVLSYLQVRKVLNSPVSVALCHFGEFMTRFSLRLLASRSYRILFKVTEFLG